MKQLTEDGEIIDTMCEDCAPVFFKTPHNHNTLKEAERTALYCTDPSKTDQSFKDDADINTIMDRIQKGAQVDIPLPEHFGIDNRVDLLTARTRIAESNATFYNLPANIRNQFLNDPGIWERRVQDELLKGNRAALREMGLDVPEPPAAPQGATPAPGAPGNQGAAPAAPQEPPKSPPGGP